MMPKARFLILVAMGMLLTGCGKTYRYKYKMTVEVETPQGLKTGSAVREIVYSKSVVELPDAPGAGAEQRGEAVAVDLPSGQTLFALLANDPYVTLQTGFGGDSPSMLDTAKENKLVRVVKPFPTSENGNQFTGYPVLVQFTDIKNPMSVKLVNPENTSASLGQGVKIKRNTIQMTDEPVTRGIEKRLPWLNDYASRRARLNGDTSSVVSTNDLSDNLGTGNFSIN
jgi:hypothetical protein